MVTLLLRYIYCILITLKLVQYDESQTGERIETKSIDLSDLLECRLNEKSIENLPKGTDAQSVIQV